MTFKDKLANSIVVLDGAMGTMLQRAGLPLGTLPEEWNVTRPEVVEDIHARYIAAGADVIYANTFGANALKFGDRTREVVRAGIGCAVRAAASSGALVALDVGSLGVMLAPLGSMTFEEAVEIFKITISAGAEAGADLIAIETMNDIYEMKAAIIAAKESCSLPVLATLVFGEDGKTMTGTSPEAAVAVLEGLGVDALGVNCSLAPAQMTEVVGRMLAVSSTPVVVKPNAGLPAEREGETVYSVGAEQFASDISALVRSGVRVVGGCCGTSPEYISAIRQAVSGLQPLPVTEKDITAVASYTHACTFGGAPLIIGERINPTGKKKLKEALRSGDTAYILGEAVAQEERGAHILDVNVGLPELDESRVLPSVICEIQAVTDLPLQIDTSDIPAMERAMRVYNGKPLVNSVNGKREVMEAVFPLVKKYGGAVIALTLDEGGIPPTAEGRAAIARKILKVAARHGIKKCDIVFDTLAMAVSADGGAALAALDSLSYIRHTLGCNTSLGVSNISFGLPNRDFINSTFFAMALARGLSAAILNPASQEMIKTYKSFLALTGADEKCIGYINYASALTPSYTLSGASAAAEGGEDLRACIVRGLKAKAAQRAAELLATVAPLDVINSHIIPALDEVGEKFEKKTLFLPQLLMSAEAAGSAFDAIKSRFAGGAPAKKLKVVVATVRGDIHDIGKNIVKTLLENYGFTVYDLGRDVPPEAVVDEIKRTGAKVCGLSALMTTTVRSMQQTIELIRAQCPGVKVVAGGAVMNAEYAAAIGADIYCRDAMATVRYCEETEKNI